LNLDIGEIRKRGRKVKLPPQPFQVLALLASSPGQLVTREAIREQLWGSETYVDFDHSLNFCVRKIREVLGESAKKPRYIETLPRRGYRFVPEMSGGGNRLQTATATRTVKAGGPEASGFSGHAQPEQTIAVLEFQNLSSDNSIDWLATGIADSLAADFRRLSCVRVVSSNRIRARLRQLGNANSSQSPPDYALLGQQIGAQWIVAGSYQRAADRLRLILDLLDVTTGEVAFSWKIDGAWDEIFELQDRVAGRIIKTLKLSTEADTLHALLAPEHLDFESYEHYSKGRRLFQQLGVETLEEARQHFERAVGLDPQYAMAQSGLGATYAMRYIHRTDPEDLEHAYVHLDRARQLDPELAEPYPWLCYVHMRRGKLKDALEVGHRAIHLLPDLVHAHYFLGLTYFVSCESDPGSYQCAVNHLLEAARVEPGWQATWFVLAFAAVLVGNYDRAEQFARRLLSFANEDSHGTRFIGAEMLLGSIFLRRGDLEASRHWFIESLEGLSRSEHAYRDGMRALSACGLGDTSLREGRLDRALAEYRLAWQILQEHPGVSARDRLRTRALAGLAAAYAGEGQRQRAIDLLQRSIQSLERSVDPQTSAAGANLADLYHAVAVAQVRAESTYEALTLLEKAAACGWRDAAWLERDSELRCLIDHPRLLDLGRQIRRSPAIDFENTESVAALHE
jgi:TolB-like protein/DNA-binding SARP family transcriptional activator/Flp pilus assembly protein TadD